MAAVTTVARIATYPTGWDGKLRRESCPVATVASEAIATIVNVLIKKAGDDSVVLRS
jgi:hypothetical protein